LLARRKTAIISSMDELDRQIAAALQINGRASWQQVAHVVGSSESTVARRAQRMISSREIRVVAIADPIRCGFGYPVLVQLKCEVGASSRVAHALAERPDVRFLALVTGSFDLVMELIVPSRRYLGSILLDELPTIEGIKETTTETVLRTFKMSYDWSRDLLGDASVELDRPAEVPDGISAKSYTLLDTIDLRLYDLLVEDGRRSFSELASMAGISESMARRRVDSLRTRGCLVFATLVEPYLLGYDLECFCWIRVDLSHLEQTATALADQREVRYLSATIGYSELICEAILRSQEDLYDFSTRTLGQLPGVRGADVGIELQTVKRANLRTGESANNEHPPRDAVSSDGESAPGHESRVMDRQREEL
jgi:DNA-binding Lrp family transcriptional regulator